MTSDHLVTKEVRRMGSETAPLLATSVVFMIVSGIHLFIGLIKLKLLKSILFKFHNSLQIFVVCTSFRPRKEENRFIECLIGCLIPLLAMVEFLSIKNYKFN
jgi:hypothetical protein